MMRGVLKSGVACGLRWSGTSLLRRTLRARSGSPWIVGYHRVVEDFERGARRSIPSMLIGRDMLGRHLDWIGRRFDLVPLDEIGTDRERRRRLRRPAAAVTFDDGYRDFYDLAFPILKEKGIPAAVFVVTSLVGGARPPLFERLYLALVRAGDKGASPGGRLQRILPALGIEARMLEGAPPRDPFLLTRRLLEGMPRDDLTLVVETLEKEVGVDEKEQAERGPLDWPMLLEMRRAGVTIGSHTRRHALLPVESPARVQEETLGSRRDLEERLGPGVDHFSYPNGSFDAATVEAVREAGYRFAYTSCGHRDPAHPLLTLPRTLLWQNSSLDALGRFSPSVMGCHADGTFERTVVCAGHGAI